ncbi:MAG TPA: ATP-binding protein [Planctomycetota bacterium]|nr:ATP-binding protein [Planctomycetota bacterium]
MPPLGLEPASTGRERAAAAATCAPGTKRERVSISFPRDTHYLAVVRKVVADAAFRAGFDPDDTAKIELAVDEACSNAIIYQVDHAGEGRFDELSIEILLDRPRFTVTLRDAGAAYPFDEKGNMDLEDQLQRLEPGGLGIFIIKNFMDEVAYQHSARDGNTLTMVKLLR